MRELNYSIKDLENFSNIKAHTIRIWEQRYDLLQPKRTHTNIRYYSESDLKKILNIKLLNSYGHKVSKIAALSDEEILEKSKEIILSNSCENHSEIDTLSMLILAFEGEKIQQFLNDKLKTNSLDELYLGTVLPLLQKIGMLWQVNSIQIIHEHYFSTIYRAFLIAEINKIKTSENTKKNAILFLHHNEEHEFAILLYQYLLKKAGYSCHYFGQKIPVNEIEIAFSQIQPTLLISTFTSKLNEKSFYKIQETLVKFTPKTKVLISGSQLSHFTISDSVTFIETIDELKSLIH